MDYDLGYGLRPQIKVVVTSGYYGDAIAADDPFDQGALLLKKPYLREDLARTLREALE